MATSRLCSIPDCGKPFEAKGFCSAHYARSLRHGDPLAGRTQSGEPFRFALESSKKPETEECIAWPYTKDAAGYGKLVVGGKNAKAHRFVCKIVHGSPPSNRHQAAHRCGNASCVNPKHLRWATSKENQADKLDHDTHTRGERCPASKLTESQVLEILSLEGEDTQKAIARRYDITRTAVGHIYSGRNWFWLSGKEL